MAERDDTNQAGRRNPARNLSREDRARGGLHSAQVQVRDSLGQFAGKRGKEQPMSGPGRVDDNRGRHREREVGGDQGGEQRG
jgi:hypothetical protein